MKENSDQSITRLEEGSGNPRLLVRDLLADPRLELQLVAGESSVDRSIEGIHLSELENPTPWMASGSLLLSTGVNVARDVEVGFRLVETLHRSEMVGLVIALGHYLSALPVPMIARAEELAFPLLTAPMELPFRRITALVYETLAARDVNRLRSSLAAQGDLLELLIEESGVSDLVARIAHLLETKTLLLDHLGGVVAEAGAFPDISVRGRGDLWEAYLVHRDRSEILPVFQQSGFHVTFREISLYGRAEGVLMAVYANRPVPESAETTLSFAQKLLVADSLRKRDSGRLQRRTRADLLDDLITGVGNDVDVLKRMSRHGLDPEGSWRLIAIDVEGILGDEWKGRRLSDEEKQDFKAAFLKAIEDFFAGQGLKTLGLLKGGMAINLIQFSSVEHQAAMRTLLALEDRLREEFLPLEVAIGVSGPGAGPGDGAVAFEQVREALAYAGQTGEHGQEERVRFFDHMNPQSRLLELQSDQSLAAIYSETLGPLEEYDQRHGTGLLETISVYLTENRSTGQTADALNVHRNTLAKRIARIEGVLGRNLSRTDDLVALQLGLKAGQIMQSGPPAREFSRWRTRL